MQPWPTLAGKDALVDFGVYRRTRESYFRVDHFCKDKHEDVVHRHKLRKTAVDSADQAGGGSVAPIVIMDRFFYDLRKPRTIADLDYGLGRWFIQYVDKLSTGITPCRFLRECGVEEPFFGYGK